MSVSQLRLEMIKKFGIHISLGQYKRIMKYAMNLIEGTLVEHYAKLWLYGQEIRISNPCSTIKLYVNCMLDRKNYFNIFYVCFEGVKQSWIEGCRSIIGLYVVFLNGF